MALTTFITAGGFKQNVKKGTESAERKQPIRALAVKPEEMEIKHI